jgi:hypothetical protein
MSETLSQNAFDSRLDLPLNPSVTEVVSEQC